MADVHRLSEQMIDFAQRMSAVADAASGDGQASHNRGASSHGASVGRWIVLPAVGAALYAAIRSQFFAREAKAVLSEAKAFSDGAKTRAADLPNDLLNSVRQKPKPAKSGTTSSAARTRGRRNTSSSKSAARSSRSRSSSRRASTSG